MNVSRHKTPTMFSFSGVLHLVFRSVYEGFFFFLGKFSDFRESI